jgi:tetratricopeptide (TPR) repeat protein
MRFPAICCAGVVVLLASFYPPALAQQLNPDEAALMLLNSARKAFNEKNHPFAAERFRAFLAKHSGHREAASARYGLALALLDGPQKDYQAALEPLQQLAGVQDFADRPFVLYYLGYAHRGLGHQSLAEAAAKPQAAAQHRSTAQQRFDQGAVHFAAAMQAFTTRVKTPPAGDVKELPSDLEWAARARCDLAEMQLRTNKFKEAQVSVEPFLKDPVQIKSRYRSLGLYHHGYAAFVQKDYITAGRSLSQLAPFQDPVWGSHVRYLLARTHHLANERPEAAAHYEAVLATYDQQKKAAGQALQNPSAFKDNPDEKLRLEALTKNPPPDYVARASFYWGVLLCEENRFADALPRFASFSQTYAGSPLMAEAQFRQGLCLVQLKQFAEALKTLQPLEQNPALADQALLWQARAQVGAADPNNVAGYDQALRTAMDTLRRGAERAQQLSASDPEAKVRRGDILMELAEVQQSAKQFKEAAATYHQVLQEKGNADRLEEALQRQASSLHLAGQYKESDDVCLRFVQTYPKSPLLADVAFRQAENAYLAAVAASNQPNLPNRDQELKRLFGEAAKRYQQSVDKYPEFPHVNLARQGLGLCHHRLGEYDKAVPILTAIPQADRTGPLSTAPYVLADCLIRTAPTEAADAIAAGRLQEQLGEAIKLLDAFLASQPTSPQAPDALLKLGFCHQQTASLLVDQQERNKVLTTARQAYERLIQQFANHPLQPVAVFERAKCLVLLGDVNGGINELNRFQADPLKNTPIAPVALLRLASLLRAQNKPADAVNLLNQCRAQHEPNLLKDPARIELAVAIRYHHGLAIKETGKLPEARAVFESIVKDFANRPEAADAAWRIGQCRREEALAKLQAAQVTLAKPGLKPEEANPANAAQQEALKSLRDLLQYFQDQANALAQKAAGTEPHLRMHYEGAWVCRALAQHEIETAHQKLQQEALKKRQEELAKQTPMGQPVPQARPPEVPITAIPLQPSEQRARDFLKALIAASADAPLSLEARLELAELHAQREEHDAAMPLLRQALEKEPTAELGERLRLRLGVCLLAKQDVKGAFGQFDAVAQVAQVGQSTRPPVAAEARYRAGECLLQLASQSDQKDALTKAIQYLVVYRDQPQFQSVPGVSDRGLLRLGHALALAGQWDQSRQALETLVGRFPQSPFVPDARYGIGWAWQNQKNFDQAVNAYAQVTNSTAAEVAARAQLQMGLCRLEQKRHAEAANALLVVPFTYDYPDLSALALCEASRVFVEMKQPQQATKLLERVIKDHPNSQWAEVAKQRLVEIR